MIKILFIGDIVGEPGRRAVARLVPVLRRTAQIDFVVANGENSAGGSGITPRTAQDIFSSGVDVITSGDHIWDQKEILPYMETEHRLLRPLNYPAGTPGHGSTSFTLFNGITIGVINAQGRTFMPPIENPFLMVPEEVTRLRRECQVIFIDFHAEATSEKIAMGRMLDGRISALVGTHTHVQTADEAIFPGGTAFLCDAGFTGPHEGVIGRDIEPIIKRFQSNMPQRFRVATEDVRLQGALITVDPESGRATAIERISKPAPVEQQEQEDHGGI